MLFFADVYLLYYICRNPIVGHISCILTVKNYLQKVRTRNPILVGYRIQGILKKRKEYHRFMATKTQEEKTEFKKIKALVRKNIVQKKNEK